LRNIIAICRTQHVRPVFIPQIMNWAVLTSDEPYGFLPYVRDKDLKTAVTAYTECMARVAKEEGVEYVREVQEYQFKPSHFIDNGHFSAEGNKIFAGILAQYLQKRDALVAPSSGN